MYDFRYILDPGSMMIAVYAFPMTPHTNTVVIVNFQAPRVRLFPVGLVAGGPLSGSRGRGAATGPDQEDRCGGAARPDGPLSRPWVQLLLARSLWRRYCGAAM